MTETMDAEARETIRTAAALFPQLQQLADRALGGGPGAERAHGDLALRALLVALDDWDAAVARHRQLREERYLPEEGGA